MYAGKNGAKFSIKQAFDKYSAAPYGYTEEDIEFKLGATDINIRRFKCQFNVITDTLCLLRTFLSFSVR